MQDSGFQPKEEYGAELSTRSFIYTVVIYFGFRRLFGQFCSLSRKDRRPSVPERDHFKSSTPESLQNTLCSAEDYAY